MLSTEFSVVQVSRPVQLVSAWLQIMFGAAMFPQVSGVPLLEKAGAKKWGQEPEYRHYMEDPALRGFAETCMCKNPTIDCIT